MSVLGSVVGIRAALLVALAAVLLGLPAWSGTTPAAAGERVHLDVRLDIDDSTAVERLVAVGFEVELAVPSLGRWQGWLASGDVEAVRSLAGVLAVREPVYASFAAGAALTEGDEALNAAAARERFDVDGSGVRVAVISDGIRGLASARAQGEVPALAEARAFGSGDLNRGQEGTVMIEIIHDLAPGAAISFGAVATDLDHIAAVNHFASRVDIIVDDVSYAYPADQRSDVSRNTTAALSHPAWPLRVYLTAAGNWAESHWSGEWREGPMGDALSLPNPGRVHLFGDASAPSTLEWAGNGLGVANGEEVRLALFWDDPPGRATNDYDLFLLTASGELAASSEVRQGVGVAGGSAREHLVYVHDGPASTLYAVVQNHNDDAASVRFDLFAFRVAGGGLRLTHHTPEGSLLAQSDAEGALTVGAVNVGNAGSVGSVGPGAVAVYSSRGPTLNGVQKPELTAVDQVTVSGATQYGPSFAGTSAAAPHAAAVAALLLEAQPALTASDGGSAMLERRLARAFLTETARDIAPVGLDAASGAGLVDAEAALSAAVQRVTVVSTNADAGEGSLREALASGADFVLMDGAVSERTIVLESDLPQVGAGVVVDGTSWTVESTGLGAGLQLGDGAELWGLTVKGGIGPFGVEMGSASLLDGVTVDGFGVGVRVLGEGGEILRTRVAGSSIGVQVQDDASLAMSGSDVARTNDGVRIMGGAGDVVIGPDGDAPAALLAGTLPPPISPLVSASLAPRSGLSHAVSGAVSIDGLPAPQGTVVDMYLDRRLAASVAVDAQSRFAATAAGPGEELRFAVDGAALWERVSYEAGGRTSVQLRAVSGERLAHVGWDFSIAADANTFRDNGTAVEIVPSGVRQAGRRYVWGNVMQGNSTNMGSDLPPPRIEEAAWSASGLSVSGLVLRAPDVSEVHLYAGPPGDRRYVGSVEVADERFSFTGVDAGAGASELSVVGHTRGGRATLESAPFPVPPTGVVRSVSPSSGYIGGGESVAICGDELATLEAAPEVWFGGAPARVSFWSEACVTVSTPSAVSADAVDVVVLLAGRRPVVAREAYTYSTERVVRLLTGWNLVTWSGAATRVTTAVESLAGVSLRIFGWDAGQQEWLLFSTELPSHLITLRTVLPGQPLWVWLDGEGGVDWPQPSLE